MDKNNARKSSVQSGINCCFANKHDCFSSSVLSFVQKMLHKRVLTAFFINILSQTCSLLKQYFT